MSEEKPSGSEEIHESSRKQRARHSLQPTVQEPFVKDTRLTQSQSYGRRQRSKVSPVIVKVPSIPEDEEVNKPFALPINLFGSFLKSDSKRKNSDASNRQNVSVSDNCTQTQELSQCDTFETASQEAVQRNTSLASNITNPVQVQKEQYWLFSKWPARKKSILIGVIIVLLVVIVIQLLLIIVIRL